MRVTFALMADGPLRLAVPTKPMTKLPTAPNPIFLPTTSRAPTGTNCRFGYWGSVLIFSLQYFKERFAENWWKGGMG